MQDFADIQRDEQERHDEREERFYHRKHAWINGARKVYKMALTDHELCMALRVENVDAFDWNNQHAFEIADMRLSNT